MMKTILIMEKEKLEQEVDSLNQRDDLKVRKIKVEI